MGAPGTSGRVIEGVKAHHSDISDLRTWDRTLNKSPFPKSFPLRARFSFNIEGNFLAVMDKIPLSKGQESGGRGLEDFLEGKSDYPFPAWWET